jgi:hypothetical protein
MTAWTIDAEDYLLDLAERAVASTELGHLPDDGWVQQVLELKAAIVTGKRLDGRRFSWWERRAGTPREAVWLALNRVEIFILDRTTDRAQVTETARQHLSREMTPTERTDWLRRIEGAKAPEQARSIAAEAVRQAHQRSTARRRTARARRRIAVTLALLLGLVAGGLVAFQAWTTALLVSPPQDAALSPAGVLGLVLLLGLVGGALTSVLRVYSTPRWQTRDCHRCDPRPAQVAIRLAAAPWSSLVSVLVLGGGLGIPAYRTLPAVMLVALAGGFGQEVLTRRLDRLAEGAIGPVTPRTLAD